MGRYIDLDDSKTGRMISALDLANRIVADAARYHTGMGVLQVHGGA